MMKSKKKILNVVLGLSVLGVVVVGGTFAYLTDTEQASNVFTVGNVTVDLVQTKSPLLDADPLVPNEEVELAGYIENTGQVDAIVYMSIAVPAYDNNSFTIAGYDGTPMDPMSNSPLFSVIKGGSLHSFEDLDGVGDWELVEQEDMLEGVTHYVVYTYGYSKVMQENDIATIPFQAVKVANIVLDSNDNEFTHITWDMPIRVYAIQSDYVHNVDTSSGTISETDLQKAFTIQRNQEGGNIDWTLNNANTHGSLDLLGNPR